MYYFMDIHVIFRVLLWELSILVMNQLYPGMLKIWINWIKKNDLNSPNFDQSGLGGKKKKDD